MTAGSTADYLHQVFDTGGYLAGVLEGYAPRPGQLALATAVDRAIEDSLHLLAEAPTGTGKTLSYAVPLTYHCATGRRAVIATANIALQEQLVGRDLPLLDRCLPWGAHFALLKGKGNYLCLDRLHQLGRQGELTLSSEPHEAEKEAAIHEWAGRTTTGDVSELPFEPPPRLWRRFSVVAEDCLGPTCRHHAACFATRARELAGRADIVVTNYHLLFAHLAVQEATGDASVLPPFDCAVLDEGHRAADVARDFFGFRATLGGVRWAGRLLRGLAQARLHDELERQAVRFFDELSLVRRGPGYRARLTQPHPVPSDDLCDLLHATSRACREGAEASQDADEHAELIRTSRRAAALATQIAAAMALSDPETVYYIDLDDLGRSALCGKPITVATWLSRNLFDTTPSVTMTSATLSIADSFTYARREVGLEESRELIVASPFTFEDQVLMVAPQELPDPVEAGFPDAVAETFAKIIDLAQGRTLGLFTSYRNLNLTHDRVANRGHRVLRQGDRPRSALIEEFRQDVSSVLLGTESFWSGIDVPGEALSCLVIDRLPFLTPDDPLIDALAARDPRCFMNHSLPRAVITFKQAFGRLIRGPDDRGVVVVLDTRLFTRRYGELFLASLPRVPMTRDLQEISQFLRATAWG